MEDGLERRRGGGGGKSAACFGALTGTLCYKAFYELAVDLWVYVPFRNLQKLPAVTQIPGFLCLVHFINWYFQFIKSPLLGQKSLATTVDSFTLKKI